MNVFIKFVKLRNTMAGHWTSCKMMCCVCCANCSISTRRKCSAQSGIYTTCTSCMTYTSSQTTTQKPASPWSYTLICCRGLTGCFRSIQTLVIPSSLSGSAKRRFITKSSPSSTAARYLFILAYLLLLSAVWQFLVDLRKPALMSVSPYVRLSVRPQKVSPIRMKFGM